MKVVVSAKAYADLQNIYLFLAERDQGAAERAVAHINKQFASLGAFPQLGRPWPEPDAGTRRLVAGGYLLFYREKGESLLILRVLDGRMDVEAELLK